MLPGRSPARVAPRRGPVLGLFGRLPLALGLLALPVAGAAGRAQPTVEESLARLESADANTRRGAASELARHGGPDAVAGLNAAAADPHPRVRRAVLEALLSLRRPSAAPGLVAFLADAERDNRRDAIRGLVEMHGLSQPPGSGTRAVNWLLRQEHEFVLDPLRPVSGEVVTAIVGSLADDERSVRETAVEALGALRAGAGSSADAGAAAEAETESGAESGAGTESGAGADSTATGNAIAALADAARIDSEAEVRRDAVRALGRIATPAAGEALLTFLPDREAGDSRAEAVRALGRMAYAPAGAALLAIYDERPDSGLGRDALEGLARIGFDGARGTFYFELGHRDAKRREFAAEGLGRLDDPSLADGLVRDFLREDDGRVQLAFAFSLVRLGRTPFVDRIVLSLDHRSLGEAARQYALELGAPLIPEYGRYLREDPDRDLRLRLVELLERIGDPAAVPALTEAAADEDTAFADRARTALRRLRALTGAPEEQPGA